MPTSKATLVPGRVLSLHLCTRAVGSTQKRNASTARRHKKLLNIAPHPLHGGAPPTYNNASSNLDSASRADSLPRMGTSGRSRMPKSLLGQAILAAGDRVVYAPPSSAPTPFHTPLKFLPPNDMRRTYLERQRASRTTDPSGASTGGETLPAPIRKPYQKTYHMSAESIEEMRRLRLSDENKWTRSRLAEKFGCTQFFVSLVVQASEARQQALKKERRAIVESWGRKKRTARAERARRREMWARDE